MRLDRVSAGEHPAAVDELLAFLMAMILLVPVVILAIRLPENLAATFAMRRDDAWPIGMQEQDVPTFRWAEPGPPDTRPTAKVKGTVSRRRVAGQSGR